jgi:hypothetical protein
MYHKIYIFVISLLCILSCDKVTDPYQEKADIVSSRKILIEEFTGHTCGNCPEGSLVLNELTELFGDNLVAVSMHAGSFAYPICDNEKFCTEFRTQTGETFVSEFQIDANPVATVNRALFSGLRKLDIGAWATSVNELLAIDADITMEITASIDTASRNLEVSVNSEIVNAVAGDYSISVGLVEDSIVDYQKFYAGQQIYRATNDAVYQVETNIADYLHRHVFRGNINGVWGEAINLTVPVGNSILYTAPITAINAAHKLKDMYVIAYIHNNETKEIIQVEEVHLLH